MSRIDGGLCSIEPSAAAAQRPRSLIAMAPAACELAQRSHQETPPAAERSGCMRALAPPPPAQVFSTYAEPAPCERRHA